LIIWFYISQPQIGKKFTYFRWFLQIHNCIFYIFILTVWVYLVIWQCVLKFTFSLLQNNFITNNKLCTELIGTIFSLKFSEVQISWQYPYLYFSDNLYSFGTSNIWKIEHSSLLVWERTQQYIYHKTHYK
jgi:hypothetical protein